MLITPGCHCNNAAGEVDCNNAAGKVDCNMKLPIVAAKINLWPLNSSVAQSCHSSKN